MQDFDPKFPYNDIPSLPPKVSFDDVTILKALNNANRELAILSGKQNSIPNADLIVEPLYIREAVASSGIENINTTTAEVFQAQLFPEAQAGKAQKETLHYREALAVGFRFVQRYGFLSTNAIVEIQRTLEPKKDGIRKVPAKIVNDITGEVLFTPPEGEERLRTLMANLEKFLNDFSSLDPLLVAAITHYQFEAIHPFLDGNGRTGRILFVLQLSIAKRIELPILYISGYINKHRSEYYRLLREVSRGEKWKEWVVFILQAIEEQARATSALIESIRQLKKEYEDRLRDHSARMWRTGVLDEIFSSPFISYEKLEKKLDVSYLTARSYLLALEKMGLLTSIVVKKKRVFFSKRLLQLLGSE